MLRIALLVFGIGLLVTFDAAAPAHAQATRTWVSGVGDDMALVCSRTNPCKTLAAAISVTDTNGEINCIDPGGFGSVTITKSITIDCSGTFGGIVAAGTNGITINLTATPDPLKSVVLRGLNINGAGSAGQAGLRGVSILSATLVTLDNVVISNFTQQGVADVRTAPGRLFIKNSVIRNNAGVGILAAGTSGTNVSIENVHSINNTYGLATATTNSVKIVRSVFSGNSAAGIETDPGGQVGIDSSTVNFNQTGLLNIGTMWISNSDVAFNQTAISGNAVNSFGNSRFFANTSQGGSLAAGATSTDHGQQ
jgi:hypothetical protein